MNTTVVNDNLSKLMFTNKIELLEKKIISSFGLIHQKTR